MNLLVMFSSDEDDQQPRSQGSRSLGTGLDDQLKWQSCPRSKEVAKHHIEILQRDRYCKSFNRWH